MGTKQTMMIPAVAVIAVLGSCATHDPDRRANSAAAVGAVAGAVAGNPPRDSQGRFVSAAVGALTGAAVGDYMDRQQAELERFLSIELAEHAIRVTRIDEETLRLDLSSEATFGVNSAELRAGFRDSLASLARVTADYDRTVVHLLGHTDDTGTESYNQRLSEARAEAVASELERSGVEPARLRPRGFGETRPIDNNETSSGRRRNRRVEVLLRSVVEGRADEAFRAPT